ncbi:MAG: M23 family metallopeptidase [bacterium]
MYFRFPDQAELLILGKRNANIENKYTFLKKSIEIIEQELHVLQIKDDSLYRPIIGMEPLHPVIRQAGTGGSVNETSNDIVQNPGIIKDTRERLDKISSKINVQAESFENTYERAVSLNELHSNIPAIQPISPGTFYWISSGYGSRFDPYNNREVFHHGIDFAAAIGVEIYSTGNGIVKETLYNETGYGKEVVIDHGFGYSTRYAHLHEIYVKKGEKIKRGQLIGLMGNTGKSTGPHLHYEVLRYNISVNPSYYFTNDLSPVEYQEIIENGKEGTSFLK